MPTRFAKLYGGYFLADMLLGVVSVAGALYAPARYSTWLASPASTFESYLFVGLNVAFLIHVWAARLPRVLLLLPAYGLSGLAVMITVAGHRTAMLLEEQPDRSVVARMVVEDSVTKEPDYLRLALGQSLLGLIGGTYAMRVAMARAAED
jgi:hypothetical protein